MDRSRFCPESRAKRSCSMAFRSRPNSPVSATVFDSLSCLFLDRDNSSAAKLLVCDSWDAKDMAMAAFNSSSSDSDAMLKCRRVPRVIVRRKSPEDFLSMVRLGSVEEVGKKRYRARANASTEASVLVLLCPHKHSHCKERLEEISTNIWTFQICK